MIIDQKFFTNVPNYQYQILDQFIQNHPVKSYKKADKTFEYLTAGTEVKNRNNTILLLHGAMFDAVMWFYVISRLEKQYHVIAPCMPQTGLNATDSLQYVREIMEAENISKATITGYSGGGGIAQLFAEKYPESVETLVLTHTGLLRRENSRQRIKKVIKIMSALPPFTIKILKNIRGRYGKESEWFQFKKAYFNAMFQSITKKVFIQYLKNSLEFLTEIESLPNGKVTWNGPTIIMGTESDLDTFQHFESLKKLYRNNRSYIFTEPGGHHMIFLYPEKFTNILLRLLRFNEPK